MEILKPEIKSFLRSVEANETLHDAKQSNLEEIASRRRHFNELAFGITQDAADLFPNWKRAHPEKYPQVRQSR